jgi:putative hydrolase of the HAD superfamily
MILPHLLVDFAGVIGHHQAPEDLSGMAQLLDVPVRQFQDAYWAHRGEYDRGLGDVAYWSRVAERPVTSPTTARLVQLDLVSWTRLNQETVEILAAYRARGGALTLLSNAPHFLAHAVRAAPQLSFFDCMVFSCELGTAKPDHDAFTRALAKAGASEDQTIFIDDRMENIEAAEALGITGVPFANAVDLGRSLEHLLSRPATA